MANTMPRPMRIPDPVWFSALDKARRNGTTLTAVVVAFLEQYAAEPDTADLD